MNIRKYLIDHFMLIVFYCIAFGLSGGLLLLINLLPEIIFLVELIFAIAFLSGIIWDYNRRKKYYKELFDLYKELDEKTLLAELIAPANFLDGIFLYNVIHDISKYMNDKIVEANAANQEYREFIEMWIHEIKTPITSAHLIVENDKNRTTLHLEDEVNKIERFVEQALFYARGTALEKDFKVEKTTLKSLVNDALKCYSKQIIQVGGKPEFDNLDIPILADRKWCVFVIGQIIANSVKYHRGNLCLAFSGLMYEKSCCLSITDNGIGIPDADISRVFEKGFTGENGRKYTKSTGIGLYLCKKMCAEMNMDLYAESIQGIGTTMKIFFPKEKYVFEQM